MRTTRYDPFPSQLRRIKQRQGVQLSEHDKEHGDHMLPAALKGAGAGRRNKAKITMPKFKTGKDE